MALSTVGAFTSSRLLPPHERKVHFVLESCGKRQLLPCDPNRVRAMLAILLCFVNIHISVSVDSTFVHKEVLMNFQDG